MKREYIVTLKKHEDLVSFYKDMEEFGGPKHVPNREVELKDRRAISRNTHYYLSDEEAKELEKDDRVLAVELTPEERGIEIVIRGSYSVSGDFDKNPDSAGDLNHLNWGLLHCAGSQSQRRRGTFGIGQTEQVTDSVTVFNDGENVDVVIVDEPVAYDHQEFLDPDTGQTRFVQYQWFNELDQYMVDLDTVEPDSDWSNFISSNGDSNGEIKYYNCQELDSLDLNHGTHVAGTATGKTQGWARKSNIYSMNVLGSSDTGSISSSDIISPYKVFDYLRAFHKNKDINPNTGRRNLTVTNHSWGYSPFEFLLTDLSQITSVYFRGVSYTNNGTWTESYIESTFGIRIFHIQISGQWYKLLLIPQQVAGLNADVEDAIKDGVVVITSAGNDYSYGVPQGHQDYNNIIYFSTDTENPVIIINDENYSSAALYFNRGGSPDSTEGVINVGSISEYSDFRRSPFSNYGPLIDIFAPGSNIISSIPGTNTSSYGVLSGTSMAGPQVAGIIACISTDKLEMNNEKALQHIKEIGIDDEMADTVNGGGFDDITTLRGAPNISVACKNRRDDQSILSFNDLPRSESGVLYPRKLSGKKLEFSTYNLSYTLQKDSVNVTQIQENESFSLTLFSSNAPDGTKVYYTIKQESTDVSLSNFKIDGAVPSSQGHFEINSGSSETKVFSFPQNINDAIDKGFEISLYLESERTTQYALIPKCSIKNITENYNISVNNLSNNQQDPSEMNEGQTLRFSITETTGLANENDLVDFEIYGLDGSQVSAVSSNNNSSLITFDVDGRKWTGQFKLNSQKSDFIDIVTLDDDLVLSDSANIPVYLKLVNTTRGNSTSNAFIKSNLTSVSPDYEDTTIEKYDLSSSNSVKENGATVTFNITSNVRDERSVNFSIIENTSSGYSANNIASVSGDTGTIVTWDSGTKTGTFIPDGVTGSCDINVTMKTDDIIWDGNYFTFRIDESGSQFTKDGGSQQFLNYIEKQVTIVEQSAVNFTVSYNSSETGYSEGDTLNFNFTSDKFVVSAKDLSYSIDITDSTYGEIATGDFSPGLSGTFKNDSQFTLTITDDLIIENAEYLKITFSDLSNSDTEFSPNDIVIKINQNDQNEIPLSGASISDAYYEYGPSEVANQFSTRTSLDEDDYIVFKIDTKNIGDGRWLDYNISCDGDNFSIDDIDSRWWKNSPYVARSYYSIKSENHISYSDNIQPDSDPATGKIKPLENGIAYLFIDFSFGTDTEINDKTLTLTITDPVSNQSISSNPITLFDISPESFTVTTLKNGESFNHLTENLSEGDTLTVNITPSVNWINSSRGIKYTLSGISANNLYTDTSLENSDIDPSSTPQNLQIDSEGKFSFDLNIVQDSSIENLENFTITLSDNYGSSFNKNEIDVEKIEINVDSSDTSETPNYTITSDKEVISEKSGVVTFTISSNVGDTRYVDYDVVTSSGISSISGISGTTVDSFNQKIRMKNDGSAIISITLDGSTDSSLLNESLTFKLLDSPAGNVLSEKTIVISDANPLQYTTSAKYYYGVDSAGAIGNTVNLNQVVSLYEPSVGNLSDSTSIQNSTFDSDISGWTTAVEYSTNSANVTHSDEHNGTMVFGSHQGEWSYAETPITHTNSGNQTNRIRINIPHITNNNSRFYVSILKDDNIIQNSGWINLNGINGTETTYSSINANGDGSYSGYVEVDYIDDVDLNSTYKLKIFHDQIKFSLTWAELYVGDIQIYDRDNSRIIFDFEVQNPESADLTALSRQITATITYDYDSTSVTGQSDISFNSSFEILNDSSMSSTEMKGQFILDINDDRFIENVEYFKITFVDNLNGSSTFSSNDIVIKINQNDQNEIPLSGASISDAYYQFYRSGSGTYSVSTRTSLDEDDYIVFKIDTKNIGDGRWLDYNISCDGDNSFTVDSRWWKNSPYVDIGYYSIESANHISYSDNIQPDSDPATGKIKPLEDGFAYLFIDLSSGTDTEINDKTLTLTITDPVSNQSISSNPITLFDTSPESFAVTTLKNGASFNHLTENLSEGDTLSVVVSPSNNWTNSSRGIKYTINKDSITDADITPHTSPVNLNLDSGNTFSFTINVTDDLLIENNEVFEIVLSDNYGSTFDKNNMNITVLASDTSETPNYTITSNTTTLQENGGTVDFTVTSNAGDERELDFEIIENGTSDNIKQISGLSSTTVSYNKSSRTGKVKIKEDGTCNFRITSKTDNFIWNTDNYFKIKFLETSSIFNTSDIKIDSISVNDSRSFPDSALDGYPQDLEINVEGVLSPDGYEAVLTPVLDSYGQLTNIIISNPGKYKTITSVELYSPSETLSQVILDSNGDPLLDSGNQPISIISYDTSNFQGVSSVETGVTVTNDVSPLTYSIYPYISDSEGNYDISSNNLTEASSMMFSVVPFVNEGFSRDIFYKIDKLTTTNDFNYETAKIDVSVDENGTVTSITIVEGGFGYTSDNVGLEEIFGIGNGNFTVNLTNSSITSITIVDGGTGHLPRTNTDVYHKFNLTHSGYNLMVSTVDDTFVEPDEEFKIYFKDLSSSDNPSRSSFVINGLSNLFFGESSTTINSLNSTVPEYTISSNVNTVDEDGGVVVFDISSNVRRDGQSIGFQITEDSATDNIESVSQAFFVDNFESDISGWNTYVEPSSSSLTHSTSHGGTMLFRNLHTDYATAQTTITHTNSGTQTNRIRINIPHISNNNSKMYVYVFKDGVVFKNTGWFNLPDTTSSNLGVITAKGDGTYSGYVEVDYTDDVDLNSTYEIRIGVDQINYSGTSVYTYVGDVNIYNVTQGNLGKSGTITPSAVDGSSKLFVTMKTDSVVYDGNIFDITFSETGSEFELDTDSGISISNSITKTISMNDFSPIDYKVTSDVIQTTEGGSAINVTIEATNLSDIINVSRTLNLSTDNPKVSIPSTVDITTISAGEHSGSFTITPLEDILIYPDEVNITITDPRSSSSTFLVNPDSENEAPVVGTGTLTVTVIDNDIPEYTISSDVNTVDEDGGIVVFDISSNVRKEGQSIGFQITEDSATDNIESVYQTYLFDDFANDIQGWTTGVENSAYASVGYSADYGGTLLLRSSHNGTGFPYAKNTITHSNLGTQTNRIRINIPHINNNNSKMYVQILKDGVSLYSTGYQYLRDTISSDYGVITANGDGSYSGYLEIDLTYDVDLNSTYELRIGMTPINWFYPLVWTETYIGDINIYNVTQGKQGNQGTITPSEIDGSSKLVVTMKTDSVVYDGNTFDITFSETGSEFELDTDSGISISNQVTKTINMSDMNAIDYKVTSDVIQTTEGGSAINVTIEATNLSDIINVSRTLNLSTDNPKVSIPSTVDITTISAGEHSGSFTITPLEDILIYPDEVNITITDPRSSSSTFLVNPDSENEAPVVGTGTLTVTVIDNDIPEYTITPNVNTVDEDGGVVAFDISSNVRRGGQSIGFQITEDSATDNIESVYQSLQIQPYSRYRILMTRSHNTVYTRLDLREVELINVYSQNVLREGGYLSSVYYSSRGSGSSGTPQDGNVDLTHHNDYSYYPGDSSGTHWCEWRLNSQIYIKTFRNYGLTYMKDWKFQGSNDGNTWEDILDFTDYPYKTNDDGWDEIYIFGGENLGKSGTITPSAIDGFSRLAVTMKTDSVVSDAGFDITFSETGSEFKLDTDSGISISNSITKTININEFSPVDYKVTSDAIQTTEGSSAINVTIEATNLSDIINVSRALNLSTNHGGVSIPSTVDITTISAGEHSGSFTITPLEDSLVYPDEVNITITDPQHSSSTFLVNPDSENEVPVVGTGTLTVTVIDNDIPEYTISSDVNTVDEDGGIVVFDISSNARGTSLPFEITEDSATDNIESVYQTYLFDDFASDISGWTTESYYANVTHSTLYDGTMNFSSQFEYWAYAEKPINHTISGTQTNRIRINIPHITNNVSQMYVQILKDGVSLYSTGYQYLRDTISSDYGVITANGDGSYSGYLEIDLTYDVDLNSEYKLRIGHQGAGWNNTWKSTYVGDVNIYSVTQGNLGKSGTITLSEIDGSSKLVVKMKTDSASTPGNTFDITFSESGSEFKLDTDSGFTSDSVTKTININEQG